ncbi:MAG TPA: hypothetical protein VN889_04385 [Solirubrobacteraceae bacterium]|nr:hypothetical protein [Solirubrobacteraceae bacterium]
MEIRSYRRVFDLERRIYRVEELRLNPTGVPVRGIVYFLALLGGALVVSRAPLFDMLARRVPWYVREALLPALLATLLAVIKIDGRSFHLAARSMLRFRVTPSQLAQLRAADSRVGARWSPPPLLMIPDGSGGALRRFRYSGPGAVRVNAGHRRERRGRLRSTLGRGPDVVVHAAASDGARAAVIVLERDARLEVR